MSLNVHVIIFAGHRWKCWNYKLPCQRRLVIMPCLKCQGYMAIYRVCYIRWIAAWLIMWVNAVQCLAQLQWAKNMFKLCIINLVKIVSLSCKPDMTWPGREEERGVGGWLSVNIFYAGGKRKAWNLHSNWRVSDARERTGRETRSAWTELLTRLDTMNNGRRLFRAMLLCQNNDDDDAFRCASDMLIMRNFIVLSRVDKEEGVKIGMWNIKKI